MLHLCVGRTLKEIGFRGKYQAAVVAIHRAGHRVSEKFGEVRLRVGDNLILLTDPGFRDRWRDRRDFLLVSRMGGVPPSVSRKSGIVGMIAAGVVVCAASGLMPILHAALLAGILLILLGVLTPGEARGSIQDHLRWGSHLRQPQHFCHPSDIRPTSWSTGPVVAFFTNTILAKSKEIYYLKKES